MDATTRDGMQRAIEAVIAERQRQEAKWGEQNHPMVPAEVFDRARASHRSVAYVACYSLGIVTARDAREVCDLRHRSGDGTYSHILIEEVAEFIEACAIHGETSDEARAEMVQVAAVALSMLEAIDRKRAKVTP